MTRQTQNARFWVYVNSGPVKITLQPGETISHTEGGACEEGHSVESTCWEYPDDEMVVHRSWEQNCLDCDGRLDRYTDDKCPLDDLRSGDSPYVGSDDPATWEGIVWPNWGDCKASQRDHAAEAMGY